MGLFATDGRFLGALCITQPKIGQRWEIDARESDIT